MFDWLRFVDATFSTYKDDSEISRINRGELDLADAHETVREVLDRCEELRQETDGYFDVHAPLPGRIDPSGLVKGWAVDRAGAILDEGGARNYAVNAGGDMVLRGGALPDDRWRVGIQHPLDPRPDRQGRRGERSRRGDVGRVRARRPRRRPAHCQAADRECSR